LTGRRAAPAVLLGLVLLADLASIGRPSPAYVAGAVGDDTLRARLASAHEPARGARGALGAVVTGYLSPRGLPPLPGALFLTDTGLVFRSTDGRYGATLPLVGPVRRTSQGSLWRASAVTLAYVDQAFGRPAYVFRVDGGVFETEAPGALLDVAAHPAWLDSLASREWTDDGALVNDEPDAATGLLSMLMNGSYADSLYAVFGRPARPAGLVGERGRAAGRLGEYIATRDSVALDPARMSSVGQLRHTLAHELAHRWQAHAPAQVATLWRDVPPITDPRRYGYASPGEHQAEAAAFAIHFLLATGATRDPAGEAARLDHYELLVPGTRALARYFALQPIFRRHPLRALLTTGRPS
jgi:hypothetical protein